MDIKVLRFSLYTIGFTPTGSESSLPPPEFVGRRRSSFVTAAAATSAAICLPAAAGVRLPAAAGNRLPCRQSSSSLAAFIAPLTVSRGRGNPAVRAPVEDIPVQDQQQEVEAAPPVQPRQPGEPPAELDDQGRALCFPDASRERLLNSGPVSRSMREIFRKCWFENGRAWRFLTPEQRDFYWEEFKKEYWWDTADYSDDVIKGVFMTHAANRYKDVIHRMREKDGKHTSISQDIWDSWQAVWASEDEKKKSDVARANRMSEPAGAGSGPVRHTGGSRSAIRHMDVLADELGRKPTATELYTRMHSTKADKGVMVDKRAQDMSDAIAQRLAAASQPPTGEGGSSSTAEVDETQLFLDIEGVNKKRRVYGLGSATSAYVDTTTSSRARTRSTQSQRTEEEIERRVRAGIQDGLRQITTEVEDLRAQQARTNERMAEIIQAEMAKMMQTLPPQYRPPPGPSDDDDTPTL
ncbi:uncharacterized protein LOC126678487 [Mercurialis annua]|uniref:uncharacterized protein LOC126678487 n=2 Tax=Mercurialis annua TaxID=3986 RepID=UPI0024AF138D|nr:uncharacterized protein LOC126678487 [Mercurialis annua]